MRFKQKIASMLTYLMLIGVVVMIIPAQAKAATPSVDNLGSPTAWNYNGVDYEVYNGLIPSSNNACWYDALEFVDTLNAANNGAGYQNHTDWQLLDSEEMAKAWYKSFQSVSRGDVVKMWSSVEVQDDPEMACVIGFHRGSWGPAYKNLEGNFGTGFVVLRRASGSESDEGTINLTSETTFPGDESVMEAVTDETPGEVAAVAAGEGSSVEERPGNGEAVTNGAEFSVEEELGEGEELTTREEVLVEEVLVEEENIEEEAFVEEEPGEVEEVPEDASLTGSVLSNGSMGIIIGVAVAAVVAVSALVIFKKKQGEK